MAQAKKTKPQVSDWKYRLFSHIFKYVIVVSDMPKRTITYHLSIFSSTQMAKPKTKRGDPKSDFFRLNEDDDWDTMKAQVMAKIDMILKPATISYDR
jgi:hypothetical protein